MTLLSNTNHLPFLSDDVQGEIVSFQIEKERIGDALVALHLYSNKNKIILMSLILYIDENHQAEGNNQCYLILSMIYLSGTKPLMPLQDPFHQSLETCE